MVSMPQSDFWPFGKGKSAENVESGDDATLLQKQLGDMEGEVKEIQMELAAMKRNRLDSTTRRKGFVTRQLADVFPALKSDSHSSEDKVHAMPEVSKLREDLIKARNVADEERFQKLKYESKLKDLELKLSNICSNDLVAEIKETRKFSDEEVASLKTQIRDMKEETEELKISLTEKTEQSQEYRMKYLQAQQQVEELKRQLDIIEFDNKQVSDQIQIEIQKIKMQFQEKLQELAPLPDLLKGAKIQLQEAKQLQKLAEDNAYQLSNELHRAKEKLVIVVNNLNYEKSENTKLIEENKSIKLEIEEKNKEIEELLRLLDDNKFRLLKDAVNEVHNFIKHKIISKTERGIMTRLEEKMIHQEALLKEKVSENSHLFRELEELKDESTRSLNRSKERADSMRRYLHTQISELERQLIQSRAQCRACQKERDDIRQRMQLQISNLQENFELVEIRLRTLQGQVTSLKNSYTVILADEEECTEVNNRVIT